ncbi:MAG: GlsB/YeaQ/YmgE family stress response membrane protein [Planctomycetales bacterium]|nr:GlsB/YeaQ/YmgE family stress response membrane protein [Planctomycetales bacterium]
MTYLSWALIGLLAGGLAKWIVPGKEPGSVLVTMLIGLTGASAGGFLGQRAGIQDRSTIGNVAIAAAGALIGLFVYRLFQNRKISGP